MLIWAVWRRGHPDTLGGARGRNTYSATTTPCDFGDTAAGSSRGGWLLRQIWCRMRIISRCVTRCSPAADWPSLPVGGTKGGITGVVLRRSPPNGANVDWAKPPRQSSRRYIE